MTEEELTSYLRGFVLALILPALMVLTGCRSAAPAGPQPTRTRAVVACTVDAEDGFCEAGAAAPLWLWCPIPERCFAPVAILGAQHAGAGLAMTLGSGERLSFGLGAGWVAPWALESGWQVGEGRIVAGVTVGLKPSGSTSAAGD
jgi:hypothetical protein